MTRFVFNQSNFPKVKADAELFYDAIGEVACPYLAGTVAFNAKGLRHIKFKSDRKARAASEQYARLKLVHKAPEVLRLSHTVQGIWVTKKVEEQKTQNRWEKSVKVVTYYEFIVVLDDARMKVIVKEVEGGEKHFWSVIPYWRIDKQVGRRIMYSGDPEHD